ncbi:MAG: sigma factor-like helix-turn-helix DNA-binding protein [Conexibacter sp.]
MGSAAALLVSACAAVDADALDATVTVPSVTVPTVTAPSLPPPPTITAPAPVAPLPTPSVPTPSVPAPSVPAPSVPAPTVPGVTGDASLGASDGGVTAGGSVGSGDATAGGGGSASGGGVAAGGSPGGGGGGATGGDTSARLGGSPNGGGSAGVHGPASAGPSARRDGSGRDLEQIVTRARQCLDDLDARERRVLTLRAGLGPGAPLSRPQVARRLSLGVAQTGRIERRGLRRLDALAGAGACGGGAAFRTAAPRAATDPFGADGALSAAQGPLGVAAPGDGGPRFGVGGVVAHGGGDPAGEHAGSGLSLPPPIGDGGEATLLIALGLVVAIALLVRRELLRR